MYIETQPLISLEDREMKKEGYSKTTSVQEQPAHLSPRTLCALEKQTSHDTSSNSQTTHNSHTHQPLFSNLIINQLSQTLSLQIMRLQIHQQLIIASRLCITSKFVVSKGKIIQTFATTIRRRAKDFGKQTHAFLLFLTDV
jgi:hypothetical protein